MAKIHIPVGHGIRPDGTFDPGASHEGETEQNSVDPMVHEAAGWLRARGQQVRDEAYQDDPNYVGSTRDANAWPADVCVPVHRDWIHGPKGVFVLYRSTEGKKLGTAIMQACEDNGFPVRWDWLKRRTDLYILNNTKMTAALVEVGSVGQSEFDELSERRAVGRSIAKGIATYLGIPHQGLSMADINDIMRELETIKARTTPDALIKAAAKGAYRQRTNIGGHETPVLDNVTNTQMQLHEIWRRTRNEVHSILGIVASLVKDNNQILAAIADAEGLTVEEVRAVLAEAVEGLSVTFDSE